MNRVRVLILIGTLCPLVTYADTPRWLNLKIHGFEISAEVAHTPDARRQGLMHRRHLKQDQGMLFVFPEPGYHAMWMRQTYLPLSVAFIDERGVILNIADMTPLTTERHEPVAPAKFVLEMHQGWFSKRGIKAGDRIVGLHDAPTGL